MNESELKNQIVALRAATAGGSPTHKLGDTECVRGNT
jgi:hypothetical protein